MRHKKHIKLLLNIILISALWACRDDDKKDDNDIQFDQAAFLANLSAEVILPAYTDANVAVNELSLSIDSLIIEKNQLRLDEAQAKLKTAYLAWQKVSFLEFGPAMNVGLRTNANTFPTDTAEIESKIAQNNTNMDLLDMSNKKGFPALDYLLNHSNDSLILAELNNNRSNYLSAVVQDLKNKFNTVYGEWSGNYQSSFNNSLGTDVGSSSGQLINALNQHYERNFRDGKIGIPIGVRSLDIPRPEDSEAVYGGYSIELAVANFEAMKDFYYGKDGLGLDDYLKSADAESLNQTIQNQMVSIDSKLNVLNDPLPAEIQNNYQALKDS
ncbi:MAG: imelysin family protein, partial [Vicingaceae bacterium]